MEGFDDCWSAFTDITGSVLKRLQKKDWLFKQAVAISAK